MKDGVFVILTVLGWIVLGMTFPIFLYLWKRLDKKIDLLEDWRFSSKGDYMTKEEHNKSCLNTQNKISEDFGSKLDLVMESHKAWLEERLKRLESDMKLYVKNIGKSS